jgi:hypothetical protein
MPPAAVCDACGARSTRGGRVRRFNELGLGAENRRKAIHLCEECLHRRQERRWHLDHEMGQRVFEALRGRTSAASQRYSYLIEADDRIHLMRLQPSWVDDHAADT